MQKYPCGLLDPRCNSRLKRDPVGLLCGWQHKCWFTPTPEFSLQDTGLIDANIRMDPGRSRHYHCSSGVDSPAYNSPPISHNAACRVHHLCSHLSSLFRTRSCAASGFDFPRLAACGFDACTLLADWSVLHVAERENPGTAR